MFSLALIEQTAAFICVQKHGKIPNYKQKKELEKATQTSMSVNLHRNSCKID